MEYRKIFSGILSAILAVLAWFIAFFLSGGVLFREIPLALAPAISPFILEKKELKWFSLLLTMWLGALWGFQAGPVLYSYLLIFLFSLALRFILPPEKRTSWQVFMGYTGLLLLQRLFFFIINYDLSPRIFSAFLEAGLFLLFYVAAGELFRKRNLISYLPFFLLFLGILNLPPSPWGVLMPTLVVLVATQTAGLTSGIVVGAAHGVLRSLVMGFPSYEMGFLPVLAMMSFFSRKYIPHALFPSLILTTLLFSSFMEFTHPSTYIQLAGGVAFCGLLSTLFPAGEEVKGMEEDPNFPRVLEKKLDDLSAVFGIVARTFRENNAGEKGFWDSFMGEFLQTVSQGVCHKCPKHDRCWDEKYGSTYNSFYKIFHSLPQGKIMNMDDVNRFMDFPCIDLHRLYPVLKQGLDTYRLHNFWQREIQEQQDLLSQQLEEMGLVIKRFGREVFQSHEDGRKKEAVLSKKLQEEGFRILKLQCNEGDSRNHIFLQMQPCGGESRCLTHLLSALRRELGYNLSMHVKRCGFVTHKKCQLYIAPRRLYRVEVGIAAISSSESGVSGDRFAFQELKGGQFAVVLSDGMGTGYEAAKCSEAAINLLEIILQSGFSHELAVKTVNTALNLKTGGDSYATIDMALFDPFSGRTIFIKYGAAPTFIRHRRECVILEGNSPPVGVLREVTPTTREFFLGKDDMLIIMSDGALATGDRAEERLEREMLSKTLPAGAQEKAEFFLSLMKGSRQETPDDITILLLQIAGRT